MSAATPKRVPVLPGPVRACQAPRDVDSFTARWWLGASLPWLRRPCVCLACPAPTRCACHIIAACADDFCPLLNIRRTTTCASPVTCLPRLSPVARLGGNLMRFLTPELATASLVGVLRFMSLVEQCADPVAMKLIDTFRTLARQADNSHPTAACAKPYMVQCFSTTKARSDG